MLRGQWAHHLRKRHIVNKVRGLQVLQSPQAPGSSDERLRIMQTRNLSHTHTGEILQVRASPQLHLSVWCLPLLNGQWSWHTPVEGRGVSTEVARQDKQALTAAACAVSLPHTGQAGLVAKHFYDQWTHRKRFIGLQHASNKRSYNLRVHKVKWPSITRVKLNTLTHLVVVVFFPMPGKISMGLGTSPEQ